MKRVMLSGILWWLCYSLSFSQASYEGTFSLNWLEGKWERIHVKAPKKAFEEWKINRNGQLMGKGWMMVEKDTTFIEKLSFIEKEGEWYYVADVSHNNEPTFFKLIACEKNSFVCENLAHDFPKQISYSLENDILTAIISGNGKTIPFQFRKLVE